MFPGVSEDRLDAEPLDRLLARHAQAVERKRSDREALAATVAALLSAMAAR